MSHIDFRLEFLWFVAAAIELSSTTMAHYERVWCAYRSKKKSPNRYAVITPCTIGLFGWYLPTYYVHMSGGATPMLTWWEIQLVFHAHYAVEMSLMYAHSCKYVRVVHAPRQTIRNSSSSSTAQQTAGISRIDELETRRAQTRRVAVVAVSFGSWKDSRNAYEWKINTN